MSAEQRFDFVIVGVPERPEGLRRFARTTSA